MDGMIVLELANVLAGPSVGQFLAELGATVIKVESTLASGDVTRTWRLPNEPDHDVSAYFSACNSGKQSIRLNLASPQGLSILHSLADRADVVLASYKPGDAEKLGVDASTLRKRNKGLVYAQITGYGLHDPRPGYDAVIQAETGFMNMNGTPDGPPCKMPVAMMDLLAAHQLKEAILLSLWRRDTVEQGEGCEVDISLFKAGVASLANQASGFLKEGAVPRRIGSDHPSIVPYGTTFSTKPSGEHQGEEQVVLAVGSDKQFRQLCVVLDRKDLAQDERFTKNTGRVKHRDILLTELSTSIATRNRRSLLQQLAECDVPAGAVNTMPDVFELEEAKELAIWGDEGKATGLKQIAFSGSLPECQNTGLSQPPSSGADTKAVLLSILGVDDSEIDSLYDDGIVK